MVVAGGGGFVFFRVKNQKVTVNILQGERELTLYSVLYVGEP